MLHEEKCSWRRLFQPEAKWNEQAFFTSFDTENWSISNELWCGGRSSVSSQGSVSVRGVHLLTFTQEPHRGTCDQRWAWTKWILVFCMLWLPPNFTRKDQEAVRLSTPLLNVLCGSLSSSLACLLQIKIVSDELHLESRREEAAEWAAVEFSRFRKHCVGSDPHLKCQNVTHPPFFTFQLF